MYVCVDQCASDSKFHWSKRQRGRLQGWAAELTDHVERGKRGVLLVRPTTMWSASIPFYSVRFCSIVFCSVLRSTLHPSPLTWVTAPPMLLLLLLLL